jgi:hypothetical protein
VAARCGRGLIRRSDFFIVLEEFACVFPCFQWPVTSGSNARDLRLRTFFSFSSNFSLSLSLPHCQIHQDRHWHRVGIEEEGGWREKQQAREQEKETERGLRVVRKSFFFLFTFSFLLSGPPFTLWTPFLSQEFPCPIYIPMP